MGARMLHQRFVDGLLDDAEEAELLRRREAAEAPSPYSSSVASSPSTLSVRETPSTCDARRHAVARPATSPSRRGLAGQARESSARISASALRASSRAAPAERCGGGVTGQQQRRRLRRQFMLNTVCVTSRAVASQALTLPWPRQTLDATRYTSLSWLAAGVRRAEPGCAPAPRQRVVCST